MISQLRGDCIVSLFLTTAYLERGRSRGLKHSGQISERKKERKKDRTDEIQKKKLEIIFLSRVMIDSFEQQNI